MSVSASRSAFTCARCRSLQHLRPDTLISFSRYTYSKSRRYATTAAKEPSSTPPNSSRDDKKYFYKSYGPKIVGRKGRRQRADAEQLKIKSLDKESNIIVLRDIAEAPSPPKPDTSPTPDEDLDDTTKAQTVDIENLLVRGDTPEQSELFAAIEQHLPVNLAITRKTWEAKRNALADAHTHVQLKQYLKGWSKLDQPRPVDTGLEEDTTLPSQAEVDSDGAIPKSEIKDVVVSAWSASEKLPPSAQVPSDVVSEKKHLEAEKNPDVSKMKAIDQIMREVWNLDIDEDMVSAGQIEVKLTATQWALLQTRLAHDLFNLLRQPALFREVHLERDQKRNSLWIRGPRIRCEALVEQIKKAFESTVIQRIALEPLKTILSSTIEQTMDRFTPRLIREIEQSTNVHISVDSTSSTILISGFPSAANSTALRLVTMSLGISPPVNDHVSEYDRYFRGMVVTDTSSVPVGLQSLTLRRILFPTLKVRTSEGYRKPTKVAHQAFPASLIGLLSDKTIKAVQIHGHANAADKRLRQQVAALRPPLPDDSMWTIPTEIPKWRFDFGTHLAEITVSNNVRDNEPHVKTPTQRRRYDKVKETHDFFRPITPQLTTLCSWFYKVARDKTTKDLVGNRLVAKFIPSPYPEEDAVVNFECPPVEIIFTITKPGSDVGPNVADEHRQRYSWPYSSDTQLTLTAVNAIVKQERQVLCFPKKSVDVRISRNVIATANLDRLMEDEQFRSYVENIAETLQGEDNLWAPPSLTLTVPKRFPPDYPVGHMPSKKKDRLKRAKEIEREEAAYDKIPPERDTTYFFAGFESRQTRQMFPESLPDVIRNDNDVWTITDVDGGITGGKYLSFGVQNGPQSNDLEGLVRRAMWTVNLITLMDQGRVGPLTRSQEHIDNLEAQYAQGSPTETETGHSGSPS